MNLVKLTRAKTLNKPINQNFSQLLAKITETVLPAAFVSRLREGREWKNWIAKLEPNLFDDLTNASTEIKKQLFSRFVTLVEIEVHAKCNRVCSFCPNVIVDRRKNNILTDAEVLDRVFDELGSIDYRGQIKIARYSEPLSNLPYLYERIKTARAKVPHAQLAIVTNTDYLKPTVLKALREAGLDKIYMSIYLRPSEKWSLKLAHQYNDKLASKLRIPISSRNETSYSLRCTYDYEGLDIQSACINFDDFGSDRGSLLEQYTSQERTSPCREPFETFVIDYTGKVMPCCNLRSDFPQHQDFIVGDLINKETNIFGIYAGRLAGWRKSMIGFGTKEHPCATCKHRDLSEGSVNSVSAQLQKQLFQIGRGELFGSALKDTTKSITARKS